ncbi:hypothetical protein [Spirosoma areae]
MIERMREAVRMIPPVSPAFYTVRQIAHEILVSKLPEVNPKTPLNYDQDVIYSGRATGYMTYYAGDETEQKDYMVTYSKFSLDSLSEEERAYLERMFGRKI